MVILSTGQPMKFLLFTLLGLIPVGESRNSREKHALLIGIDGLRPDCLRKVVAEIRKEQIYPHFLSLFDSGVVDYSIYAGGELGTKTEQVNE